MNYIKNKALVSVILTTYNREKSIKRSLDSLLDQSYSNWELIAIDDGSKDNSYKILKDYEKQFSNIRVYKQNNRKLAYSRNRGIYLSAGEYITFLDSDDEYEPDHISDRINYMNSHPNVDFIHGGVKIIGDEFVRDKDNPYCFIHLSECTIGATFFGRGDVFTTLKDSKKIFTVKIRSFFKELHQNSK